MIAYLAGQTVMPLSPAFRVFFGGMTGWPYWHGIIWGRLVVNWILEKVFPWCLYYLYNHDVWYPNEGRCVKGALANV